MDDQSTSTEGPPRKRSIGLTRPSQTIEAAFSRTNGFIILLMTACTSADSVVPLKPPAMSVAWAWVGVRSWNYGCLLEQAHIASREGGTPLSTPHARGGSDPPQRLHHMLGGGPDPPSAFTTC